MYAERQRDAGQGKFRPQPFDYTTVNPPSLEQLHHSTVPRNPYLNAARRCLERLHSGDSDYMAGATSNVATATIASATMASATSASNSGDRGRGDHLSVDHYELRAQGSHDGPRRYRAATPHPPLQYSGPLRQRATSGSRSNSRRRNSSGRGEGRVEVRGEGRGSRNSRADLRYVDYESEETSTICADLSSYSSSSSSAYSSPATDDSAKYSSSTSPIYHRRHHHHRRQRDRSTDLCEYSPSRRAHSTHSLSERAPDSRTLTRQHPVRYSSPKRTSSRREHQRHVNSRHAHSRHAHSRHAHSSRHRSNSPIQRCRLRHVSGLNESMPELYRVESVNQADYLTPSGHRNHVSPHRTDVRVDEESLPSRCYSRYPSEVNHAPHSAERYAPPTEIRYAPPTEKRYAPPTEKIYAHPAEKRYAPPIVLNHGIATLQRHSPYPPQGHAPFSEVRGSPTPYNDTYVDRRLEHRSGESRSRLNALDNGIGAVSARPDNGAIADNGCRVHGTPNSASRDHYKRDRNGEIEMRTPMYGTRNGRYQETVRPVPPLHQLPLTVHQLPPATQRRSPAQCQLGYSPNCYNNALPQQHRALPQPPVHTASSGRPVPPGYPRVVVSRNHSSLYPTTSANQVQPETHPLSHAHVGAPPLNQLYCRHCGVGVAVTSSACPTCGRFDDPITTSQPNYSMPDKYLENSNKKRFINRDQRLFFIYVLNSYFIYCINHNQCRYTYFKYVDKYIIIFKTEKREYIKKKVTLQTMTMTSFLQTMKFINYL